MHAGNDLGFETSRRRVVVPIQATNHYMQYSIHHHGAAYPDLHFTSMVWYSHDDDDEEWLAAATPWHGPRRRPIRTDYYTTRNQINQLLEKRMGIETASCFNEA